MLPNNSKRPTTYSLALPRLVDIARNSLPATAQERRVSVLPDMTQIVQLEEWHHPNVVDDDDRPSGPETFQHLAQVLATAQLDYYGAMESLLIITGTMGAGKTSVLGEASDILALQGIAHAAIDLDALGLAHLPFAAGSDSVMYGNLRSVCENYASLGVRRVLLARAIEDRAELELCCDVVSASTTVVCRLTASIETMEQRVRLRESGVSQRDYVARVAELNTILDRAQLENFTLTNESRPLTDVARELLVKARWLSN